MQPQFPARSGITGFTREDGSFQCTGSAMGRHSNRPADIVGPCKLRVRKVRLDSGGYDDGGAYWGGPWNLYQAHGEDAEQRLSFFTRADSKAAAVRAFKDDLACVQSRSALIQIS